MVGPNWINHPVWNHLHLLLAKILTIPMDMFGLREEKNPVIVLGMEDYGTSYRLHSEHDL